MATTPREQQVLERLPQDFEEALVQIRELVVEQGGVFSETFRYIVVSEFPEASATLRDLVPPRPSSLR